MVLGTDSAWGSQRGRRVQLIFLSGGDWGGGVGGLVIRWICDGSEGRVDGGSPMVTGRDV